MRSDPIPRVHVLGNAGVDLVLRLDRMPEDGETLVAHAAARAPGGKGLNQAVVAARAGAAVRFRAPLGDDPDAVLVRGALAAEGFAALELVTQPGPTDLSVVIVDGAGGNRIVSTSARADGVSPASAEAFAGDVRPGEVLLLQGNLPQAATDAAARTALAGGGTVLLNPAPCRWPLAGMLARCHLVLNRTEARQASGLDDPGAAARALCRAGAPWAVVTLGEQGCLLAEGETCQVFPAVPTAAVDTTGAGDTFCGVLAAGLARGAAVAEVIAAAQAAAAIAVSRPGAFASLPNSAELAAPRP